MFFGNRGSGKHVKVMFSWETDGYSGLFSRKTGPLHVFRSLYSWKTGFISSSVGGVPTLQETGLTGPLSIYKVVPKVQYIHM
jgi:hypothetical protein